MPKPNHNHCSRRSDNSHVSQFSVFAKMFSSKISNICSASKQSLEMCNEYVREKKKHLSFTNFTWTQAVHELFLSQSLILNYWLPELMAHISLCIVHLSLYSFLGEPAHTGPQQLSINGACWENFAGLKPQGAAMYRVPLLWSVIPQQSSSIELGVVNMLPVSIKQLKAL